MLVINAQVGFGNYAFFVEDDNQVTGAFSLTAAKTYVCHLGLNIVDPFAQSKNLPDLRFVFADQYFAGDYIFHVSAVFTIGAFRLNRINCLFTEFDQLGSCFFCRIVVNVYTRLFCGQSRVDRRATVQDC